MRDLLLAALILTCIWTQAKAGSLMFELGAGNNTTLFGDSLQWQDQGELGCTISLRYEMEFGVCQWVHISQCMAGPPVNNLSENTLDHIGCALRWKIL